MKIKEQFIVRNFAISLKLIKTNLHLFVLACLVDLAFFFSLGLFTAPVKDRISSYAVTLNTQLSQTLASSKGETVNLLSRLFSLEVSPITNKIIFFVITSFIISYAVFVIFQSTNWWLNKKIANQKIKYEQYAASFAKINLIWLAGYVIYKLIDLTVGLRKVFIEKIAPGAPSPSEQLIFVLFIFMCIAAWFSYPELKAKALFKTPIKKSAQLIIFAGVLYGLLQLILFVIGKVNPAGATIIGILLILPLINFVKILTIKVVSHVRT
ncbi:hypothetical protein COV18_04910 [Candidatus Woesearchaeota archaeon CG10_big_fil_rev_8_21_14_0_10_37_12]|nr:MAG: hypothetical protein COV18_04910 [Candidatus Woesearchaeota archaeon CG10_big_fil_rev_8_21_14_0_10_37_12]